MKPQIYNFDTKFDFGKYKGRTLQNIIEARDSKYIGYLLVDNVRQFIFDPETMDQLEKVRFFDDLEYPYYGSGGCIPLKDMGYSKEDILNEFKKRYEEFTKDPAAYEEAIRRNRQDYLSKKMATFNKNTESHNDLQINDEYDYKDPIHIGSSTDPSENPWLDILPDDEAEAAYWNTD